MKRVLIVSIAEAALLALTLAACGGGGALLPPRADDSPGVSPSVSPPAAAAAGYVDDGADHGGRETYAFTFLHEGASAVDSAFFTTMSSWSGAMNFTLNEAVFGGEEGAAAVVLGELSAADVDGVIISASGDDLTVTNNYCNKLGMPHIYVFDTPRGADGNALAPCVELDMVSAGRFMTDWLDAYARKTWGAEYVPEKTAVIRTLWPDDPKLAAISDGVASRARELYPEPAANLIDATPSGGELTAEAAYNAVYMAIITYRGVDRWLIPCISDEFGLGAAAASETLGVSDRVAILSAGMDAVFALWNGNSAGAPGAVVAIESSANAGAALAGLIALRDGRAEPDSLWSDLRRPGDACSVFTGRLRAVTRDEYADYRRYVSSLIKG
jgi:predicted small lipoprotein YifL